MLGLGLGLNRTKRPKKFIPINMVVYTPSTWAGWTLDAGIVGDATGLQYTAPGTLKLDGNIATNFKNSTNYLILYNVVNSNVVSPNFVIPGGYALSNVTLPVTVGNQKVVVSSIASIITNKLSFYLTATETAGDIIKVLNIRVFELPVGSQIAYDAANLTADQLNVKYPF